MACNPRMR